MGTRILSCIIMLTLISLAPNMASAKKNSQPKKSKTEVKKGAKSDRLDISDLEAKYWAPKDKEFSVVQNRTYSKANRVAFSATMGALLNDSYSRSQNLSLSANYFFSERYGVELNYNKAESDDSRIVDSFEDAFGASPDHGKVTQYYGAAFNWVPFYAKMSFLSSQILYFDMAISPGLGVTEYEQQTLNGVVGKTAPTVSLDVSQQVFFSKNFALRIDYKNRWFKEEIIKYRESTPAALSAGAELHPVLRTETTNNSLLMFGIMVFY